MDGCNINMFNCTEIIYSNLVHLSPKSISIHDYCEMNYKIEQYIALHVLTKICTITISFRLYTQQWCTSNTETK